MMTISQQGIEFIKQHEGCELTVYQCSAGKWTIGYGHTGSDTTALGYSNGVSTMKTIPESVAESLLYMDLVSAENAVRTLLLPHQTLTQSQYDALVSFVYNVGITAFIKSTLAKKVKSNPNPNNKSGITNEFLKWKYAGKDAEGNPQESAGLLKRRKAEVKMYFNYE